MNNNFVNVLVLILFLLAIAFAYLYFGRDVDPASEVVTVTATTEDEGRVEFIDLLNELQGIHLRVGVLSELRGVDSVELPSFEQVSSGRSNPFYLMRASSDRDDDPEEDLPEGLDASDLMDLDF